MVKRIMTLMLVCAVALSGMNFSGFGAKTIKAASSWRSALYPENWTPGYKNSNGQFLHDFSYAGYEMGEKQLPTSMSGLFANVKDYGADSTGATDATAAIQSAINAVQNAGGGTVYLPAGTYKVKPSANENSYALKISGSNILFKGDGIGKTFIRCYAENMRYCQVINVSNGGSWDSANDGKYYYLSSDIPETPTTTIHLNDLGNLAVGDWIIIRSDRTAAWINDHNMSGFWSASLNPTTMGTTFYRKITKVNSSSKTIEIDIPTRYWMKTRDNARVYKVAPKQSNVGLMDFSIGNKANSNGSGWGEEDYKTSGTGSYNVNNAFLIKFSLNVNCFAKNIATYQAGNSSTIHMSSNGLDINKTRNLTIENCDFSHPQYEGGGGNGYGMNICGQETLIKNCSSTSARHSFSFKYAYANGNVIHHYTSTDPKYGSDFHMYLSMSNLIDCEELNGDFCETNVRPYGGTDGNRHGYTSTQTVFWNTKGNYYKSGNSYIIDSRQYKYGYIIGTQGNATAVKTTPTVMSSQYGTVDTAPEDYKEGIGNGASLIPQSLYEDQLQKRLARENGTTEPQNAGKVVGYLPSYRTSSIDSIDYSALTHLCLAFMTYKNGNLSSGFSDSDTKRIINKCRENNVKVLIALGGGGGFDTSNQPFSTAAKRTAIIDGLISYVNQYNLDGVDIDIEVTDGNIWSNYEAFVSELSSRLKAGNKLLTMAVSSWFTGSITNKTYTYFDFVNLMTYDNAFGDGEVAPWSQIYNQTSYYNGKGISNDRMTIGVPFYGYGAGSKAYTYSEILAMDSANSTRDYYNGIYYNGATTIAEKARYSKNYAGIMIWELGQDAKGSNSLLSAIKQEMQTGTSVETPVTVTDIPGTVRVDSYASKSDAVTITTGDVTYAGNLNNGLGLDYYINVPEAGEYTAEFMLAAGDAQWNAEAMLIKINGNEVARTNVIGSSSWTTFINHPVDLNFKEAGNYKITIEAVNGACNVADFTINKKISQEETSTEVPEETSTEAPEETTSEVVEAEPEIEINGAQICTNHEGFSLIYSAGKNLSKVKNVGMIYGLADYNSEYELYVGSTFDTVHSYQATSKGELGVNASEMENSKSYAMTMKFIKTPEFFGAGILARAYAELEDGSYIYSDTVNFSVYSIANVLYTGKSMSCEAEHNYLYNVILKPVNPDYAEIEFR